MIKMIYHTMKRWTNITRNEKYTYVALLILMARNNLNFLNKYWLKNIIFNSNLKIFSVTVARVISILRMIHFSNYEEQIEGDQVYKVDGVFDKSLIAFQVSFTLFEGLCVDKI
jgi:hypothetical protein